MKQTFSTQDAIFLYNNSYIDYDYTIGVYVFRKDNLQLETNISEDLVGINSTQNVCTGNSDYVAFAFECIDQDNSEIRKIRKKLKFLNKL